MTSTLSFDQYQTRCASTAVYTDRGTGSPLALAYVCLGLGETGEVQGKVVDLLTHGHNAHDRAEVAAELGDVLWYIAQLAAELEQPLTAVAARHHTAETIAAFQNAAAMPDAGADLARAGLTLGASGDVQGMVKKILRGDPTSATPAYRDRLVTELGRLLVMVAQFATVAGVDLADVAQANLDKLTDRAARGVLKGAGDHR